VHIDIENAIGNLTSNSSQSTLSVLDLGSLETILYFCIPENKKMLTYWDTVADRLFKIRYSKNIEGVDRQLVLFEPPIDPALLIKALASGINLGDAINNLSSSNSYYKFRFVYQKALDIANDVRSLGQSFLSALEKKDSENFSLLRASHETSLLELLTSIKKYSIEETEENINSILESKKIIENRKDFYKNRIGGFESTVKSLFDNSFNFNTLTKMSSLEKTQIEKMNEAQKFQLASQALNVLAGASALIPQFNLGWSSIGPHATIEFGGNHIGTSLRTAAEVLNIFASIKNHNATINSIMGGYERRQEEWDFQVDSADLELKQVEKQILASEIRKQIAEKDLQNHLQQIENSKEAKEFMVSKFTNAELYNWMSGELSSLYFTAYQSAYDLAKQAEKALQFELGIDSTDFIKASNWDSLRKGLLAGENLHFQLKQMETAYMNLNKREYELTKQISLAQINPYALLLLKETGTCNFQIPEVLFDLDFPGQYFRRIKSVSITIPAVTGPYTNINCKVTMLNNRIRKNTTILPSSDDYPNGYTYRGANDDRFTYDYIAKSIATSSGINDSGMFELNFNDERYLPFEGRGVIGEWKLELPAEYRQFDYDTISDVILTVNYTAREGVDKSTVNSCIMDELNKLLDILSETNTGLYRAVSLKTEFGNNFHQFLYPVNEGNHTTSIELTKQHFPYFLNEKTLNQVVTTVNEIDYSHIDIYVKFKEPVYSGEAIADSIDITFNLSNFGSVNSLELHPELDLHPELVSTKSLYKATFEATSAESNIKIIDSYTLDAEAGVLENYEIEDIILMFNYTIDVQ